MHACVYVRMYSRVFVTSVSKKRRGAAPGKNDVDFAGRPEGPAGKVSLLRAS